MVLNFDITISAWLSLKRVLEIIEEEVVTDSSIWRIFVIILTCVVQMPGICCSRHWWDGKRWRSTVGLHQFALVRCRRGGCWLSVRLTRCLCSLGSCDRSQCRLQWGDTVELYSWQAADEAWCVVAFDKLLVYVSSFCLETQRWTEAWIIGSLYGRITF